MKQITIQEYIADKFRNKKMPINDATLHELCSVCVEFCYEQDLPNQVIIVNLNSLSISIIPESSMHVTEPDKTLKLGNKVVKLIIEK